jgi:ABC-2 type transport system permease protein
VPGLFFPLILMAVFSGSFAAAPAFVRGFPEVDGFLDFVIAGVILQATLIGGTVAGTAFAFDLQGGFLDRLIASPASRAAIISGRLIGSVVMALAQTTLFVGLALIFGARIDAGVPGMALVLLFAALLAVAAGGLGITLALRTRSAEVVEGSFPLFFALMFFSSSFFPRESMSGWFKTVVDLNPISWAVEGMRVLIVGGGAADLALGLATAIALASISVGSAALAMRSYLGADG